MHPATIALISAERARDLREQAAAGRRAREARSNVRSRPVRTPIVRIGKREARLS
jgi:hypothetical protein